MLDQIRTADKQRSIRRSGTVGNGILAIALALPREMVEQQDAAGLDVIRTRSQKKAGRYARGRFLPASSLRYIGANRISISPVFSCRGMPLSSR